MSSHSGSRIRIGQQLKSNQSITISDHQPNQTTDNKSTYGTQPGHNLKQENSKLLSKTVLLSSQVQRLTRLSQDQQGKILSLTQQIQIKETDKEGFRTRESILQQELNKLQVQDKQLLAKNHKLEQVLLEKNRVNNQLEEEIEIYRSKAPVFNKDTSDEKTVKIKELEEIIGNERSKSNDLERQLREALVIVDRNEARINAKSENDRVLLMNSEKKILDLEQQLRKYVAQKQRLQENELRFRQQQITLETTRTFEYTKQVQQLQTINNDLVLQKQRSDQHIREVQKLLSEAMAQIADLKFKLTQSVSYQKQISNLQNDLSFVNTKLMEKQGLLSQINMSKSDLEYKLQTTANQLRRLEGVYTHLQNQSCKGCHQLECEISVQNGKIKWLEEMMQKKEGEYKTTIQKTEKELKNLRELLESVNNLKGSNERVSKLIEVSTQKLMRPSYSNKTFTL